MDRVDIRVVLGPPDRRSWSVQSGGTDSATVRARVALARGLALRRCAALDLPPVLNGAQPAALLRGPLAPVPAAADVLGAAISSGRLSARGADRAIRVAWSLADLTASDRPGPGSRRPCPDPAR